MNEAPPLDRACVHALVDLVRRRHHNRSYLLISGLRGGSHLWDVQVIRQHALESNGAGMRLHTERFGASRIDLAQALVNEAVAGSTERIAYGVEAGGYRWAVVVKQVKKIKTIKPPLPVPAARA